MTFPQGTLKPGKVSGNHSDCTGPPIVTRVIAIDNSALRGQFKAAMDAMEARGGGGSWDEDDALRVLRMSVPDIAQ